MAIHRGDILQRAQGDPDMAVILLHGRGASARAILDLGERIAPDALLLAPQADGREWYPRSFLAPRTENQPHLDAALTRVADALDRAADRGIDRSDSHLVGFSQGACLAAEFAASNPDRYGSVGILSGGLIGDTVDTERYTGDMDGTPVFLGCSDQDPHIPVDRVHLTAQVLDALDADVDERIYPGMGHTVTDDEVAALRDLFGP